MNTDIAAKAAELINGRVRRFTDTEKAAAINIIRAAIEKATEQLTAERDHYKMLTQEVGQELRAAQASEDTKRLNIYDIDILERYPDDLPAKAKGHRHWGRMSWLMPGDIVCQISGKTAKTIDDAMRKNQI